jgi:hypothetical protein
VCDVATLVDRTREEYRQAARAALPVLNAAAG